MYRDGKVGQFSRRGRNEGQGDRCGVDGVDLAAEQPNLLQRRAHRRGVDRRGDPGGADLVEGDIGFISTGGRPMAIIVTLRDLLSDLEAALGHILINGIPCGLVF